jgi:uncharacterized protein YjbI with pentapeptide repeats
MVIPFAQKGEERSLDLQATNFEGANLWQTNLQNANLEKVNLKGANLQELMGLTAKQLGETDWDETTRWPEGFTPPRHAVA